MGEGCKTVIGSLSEGDPVSKIINKKKIPSVAIVIPNLNQGRFLKDALDSIINHKNLELHIAVMDAGSLDDSKDIIFLYSSHLDYWQSEPDGGQANAINIGVKKLPPTDYICWLNADDTFMENGLNLMVDFLERYDDYLAVYSKGYITDINNRIISEYPTEDFSLSRLAHHCFICQPATLIRRSVWDKIDGLNPDFHMCMDYELWWRILKKGNIGYMKEFTACSRDHEETKSRNNKFQHFNEAFLLLKQHNGYVPWHWSRSYGIEKSQTVHTFSSYWTTVLTFVKWNFIKSGRRKNF